LKKRILLALVSVAVTVNVAGVVLYSQVVAGGHSDKDLAVSLEAVSASLGTGPAPAVASSYDLSAHQTLSRVVILIKENYVEPERIQPYEMFLGALDYIEKTVAEVIVDDSQAPRRIAVSVSSARHVLDLERLGGLDQLWEVTLALRDIFQFVQEHIEDPEQRRDIEYAAINGMLSSLDPHSILLKPENFEDVKMSTKGEFGGLGIVISIREGALTVVSPIEGTPASRAGLKAKDQIVKIGEESTVNMSLDEAVSRLRGKPGTRVNIWVQRKGWSEPRRYSMTRAVIKIESVASRMLDDGIGYVKVKSFQANTFDDLHTHLERLRRRQQGDLNGLVLDLRNNPGGLLDQAILVSDRFVDRGAIVITVGEGNRRRDVKSAHASGTEDTYPIAVLVNGGSASASEIVSGALKNHDRAIVIGQQTFGKGSVQVLYDFKDRSALKLTIAQYLTPGDISIQSVGITPDIEIMPASINGKEVRLFVADASPREADLERHLETPAAVTQGTQLAPAGAEQFDPRASKPVQRIVHLVEAEGEAEPPEEETTPPGDSEPFEYDFEISLARDVLAQSRGASRHQMLQTGRALFEARAREQEQRITEALEELGVIWEAGEARGEPRAEVTLALVDRPRGRAEAGETVELVGRVRNRGDAPLYRVYGITESKNPRLRNLEFVFGRILPGETRTWKVPVKLPRDGSPRADEVSLTLGDLHGQSASASASLLVAVSELPKPRFAFAYRINDRKQGNGDGVVQVGETVDLEVALENLGSGDAADALVSVKNLSSKAVFLKSGRAKVGSVPANGRADAALRFTLRNQREDVRLRISVWDGDLGEAVSDEVVLPVGLPRRARSERRALRVLEAAPVYAGATHLAPALGRARKGATLRSDASFGGEWWRIQVGPDDFGFVSSDSVKPLTKLRKPSPRSVVRARPQSAPWIAVTPPDLVTGDSSIRLQGTISDEQHLKDFFIYVNDKKVFYRSLANLRRTEAGVSAPLDVALPLKPGSNAVTVVARESDDLVSRASYGIFLQSSPAVANIGPPPR
jgi:carboxyl-terminal processing protease